MGLFLLYLLPMKKKLALVNLYLMATVLFTILFQSLHTYRHLIADYFEEPQHCLHSHDDFSHQHDADDCSVCDFTFWYYIKPPIFNYRFDTPLKPAPYILQEVAQVATFSGSLFSHRGPPTV